MNDTEQGKAPANENAPEQAAIAAAEAIAPADALAAEFERAKAEAAQLKDQLLRALAESENTRRRARREVEDTAKFAIAVLARDMLSVADNLQRAIGSVASAPASDRDNAVVKALVAGVELTERELLAALERAGIKRIEALGQRFDHNLHQAVFEVESASVAPGTVVQVIAPGYVLHDRLLRPATVGVAKAPPAAAGGEPKPRIDTVV